MSASALRKTVQDRIKKRLDKPGVVNKIPSVEQARRLGQSAILSQTLDVSEKGLKGLYEGFKAAVPRSLKDKEVVTSFSNYASKMKAALEEKSVPFPTGNLKTSFQNLLKDSETGLIIDDNLLYFGGTSFKGVKNIVHECHAKILNIKTQKKDGKDTKRFSTFKDKFGNAVNLDHGFGSFGVTSLIEGTEALGATLGVASETAVSPKEIKEFLDTKLDTHINFVHSNFTKKLTSNIDIAAKNLILDWVQNIEDGQVRAGMGIALRYVSRAQNSAQANLEKADLEFLAEVLVLMLQDFEKEFDLNFGEISGSSTLYEKTEQFLMDPFYKAAKNDPNITTSKNKKTKLSTKTNVKDKTKARKQKINLKKPSKGRKFTGQKEIQRGIAGGPTASLPLEMITLFNSQLPQVVEKNMHSPRLNYRTGRFANSVRVTDVVATPEGYPSFGYTYQKNPYQTFEPGYLQGDPDRDPRKLIQLSMREIAAEQLMTRFYMRRV